MPDSIQYLSARRSCEFISIYLRRGGGKKREKNLYITKRHVKEIRYCASFAIATALSFCDDPVVSNRLIKYYFPSRRKRLLLYM
ncbi:hypothetical protein PUN28_001899 [Cardiocondyla obscurior]|uniref:Uncharacterized protein n=1 Tax=Cardiocondyla obscurior TaxID=286306 RepID=A0AAW2GRM3_9HYME